MFKQCYFLTQTRLISFPSVSIVKCKQLDSKEIEVNDFEDAIEQMLRDTEERDLDKLIRNFIQSRSPLNMTKGYDSWAFDQQWKHCDVFVVIYFH